MFSRLITLLQFLRMRKRKKKKKPLCFNGGMGGIGKKRKGGTGGTAAGNNSADKAGASGPPAPPMETGSPSPPPPPPSLNRRTRMRFFVAEETALLHAVEEFGTERWHEVKSCAFLNVDHRTPKDLSDKWKSLIRTAKLCPEKRRGVHLAQHLLDRVLAVQCKGFINPIPEGTVSARTEGVVPRQVMHFPQASAPPEHMAVVERQSDTSVDGSLPLEMVASEETGVAAIPAAARYPLLFEPPVPRVDAPDAVHEGYNLYPLICLSDPSVLESLKCYWDNKDCAVSAGRVQGC